MYSKLEIINLLNRKQPCVVKEGDKVCSNIKKGNFNIHLDNTILFRTLEKLVTKEQDCYTDKIKTFLVDKIQDLCTNCDDSNNFTVITLNPCEGGLLTESGNSILTESGDCIYPEDPIGAGSWTMKYKSGYAISGTPPIDNNIYKAGDTVTILGNSGNLTITGKTFIGWDKEFIINNTSIPDYSVGQQLNITQNMLIPNTTTTLTLVPKFI